MSRPPAHQSGPAVPTQVRLSPYHLAILDSFTTSDRNRSAVISRLLERANAARPEASRVPERPSS